jgi:hypothetical protein
MSVDLMLPAAEKIVLVLEGIGDDKIQVNSSSLDHPVLVLPDQGLEIVGIEKKVMAGRVGARPTGSTTTRPGWSVTRYRRPCNASISRRSSRCRLRVTADEPGVMTKVGEMRIGADRTERKFRHVGLGDDRRYYLEGHAPERRWQRDHARDLQVRRASQNERLQNG